MAISDINGSPAYHQPEGHSQDVARPSSPTWSDDSMSFIDHSTANNEDATRFMKVLRFTKEKAKKSRKMLSDTTQGVKKLFGAKTRNLCTACEQIPFNACLPDSFLGSDVTAEPELTKGEPLVFVMSLRQILNHREWCKFCRLLYRSCCQPENDLFKAEHIKNHLHDSQRLRDVETFAQWSNEFPIWKRVVGGEDIWPFGYTVDQQQAARNTLGRAKELFQNAEHKDINTNSLVADIEEAYDTGKEAELAMDAVNIGIEAANVFKGKSEEARKIMAGVQMAASQLAILNSRRRRRLPCLIIIRAYRKDEKKAGVLSVRVYGHGRAALAQIKEICHFSLRFEGSDEPRITKEQIWYGRTLGTRVDIEFFKTCTDACQKMHKSCNSFPWPPIQQDLETYRYFPFRLIDVETMQIIETDFEEAVKPQPHPYHLDYVALTYTWGVQFGSHMRKRSGGGLNGWRGEDRYNWQENPHHRPPTQLNTRNLEFLLQEGSLESENVYVPATIRDAIKVARGAGQRYLWVDSLCIIQEELHPDNEANIARMSRIYGEAHFTIVAADSPHADAGLKGVSKPRAAYEQILEPDIIKGVQVFLPVSFQASYHPWESRAWCFQEKVLSRRLLVFAGGFAVWYCGGGVWREDVNALDGDNRHNSFSWQRLIPSAPPSTAFERLGLRRIDEDESVRLFRQPAIDQYIKTVEDFSRRDIGDSWRILDAFKGVGSLLESPSLLGSPLRHGLPSHFMDIALLWQPRGSVRRRRNKVDEDGNITKYCPPSWTWAGWESIGQESKGAAVFYEKPFDVQADDKGILMLLDKLGEERIRPRKGLIWGKVANLPRTEQLGMFSLPDMQKSSFKDWESDPTRPAPPPRILEKGQLSDRHLVLKTEVASLYLGKQCVRIKHYPKLCGLNYCREMFEDKDPDDPSQPDITISYERWIIDAKTNERVGIVKMNGGNRTVGDSLENIEALILSEAQFLGNEKRVDVLGYPLYNIMIIQRKWSHIAERVGLGKIYKSAWKRAEPRREVIVLE